jgi:hypothetical protein
MNKLFTFTFEEEVLEMSAMFMGTTQSVCTVNLKHLKIPDVFFISFAS